MCKLNDHELGDLRTRQFWRKAEHMRMQAKVGQVTDQFRVGSFATSLSVPLYDLSAYSGSLVIELMFRGAVSKSLGNTTS